MAAAGWDDDGVRTQRWYLIKNGIFQTYQTTRDQAHLIGEKESRGCSQADSYDGVPFQRMPNVILEPGQKPMSLDDLIAGVDDGVLVDRRGSYSIDQSASASSWVRTRFVTDGRSHSRCGRELLPSQTSQHRRRPSLDGRRSHLGVKFCAASRCAP